MKNPQQRLAEIRERLAKVTPGPWQFRCYADGCTIVSLKDAPGRSCRDHLKGIKIIVDAQIDDDQKNETLASADSLLIAHSHADIASLLRIAEASEEFIRYIDSGALETYGGEFWRQHIRSAIAALGDQPDGR